MRYPFMVAMAVVVAACGGGTREANDTAAGSTAAGGMAGHDMGNMQSNAMMDSMTVHMSAMETANAAALQSMVPMHRQMAANMVAQINTEMGSMKMPADQRFTALMDSVRQDLTRLPDVSSAQLKAFMTDHHGRLSRLMQSHRDMMTSMKR